MTDKFEDVKQKAGSVADNARDRATEFATDVGKKASDAANDIGTQFDRDLGALREDVTKLTASVTDLVKNQASTARTTVLGVVGDARDRAVDQASDARERVTAATADFESMIERNPLLAVGAALMAGLFVGVLSRPRS